MYYLYKLNFYFQASEIPSVRKKTFAVALTDSVHFGSRSGQEKVMSTWMQQVRDSLHSSFIKLN